MNIVLDVVAGPLGPAGLASAAGKLKSAPAIVESLASVGVEPRQIPLLASVEILSVRGLLASIWSRPLGVAAALGFVLYFLGGVSPHLRAKGKLHELAAPSALLVVAGVTVILKLHR